MDYFSLPMLSPTERERHWNRFWEKVDCKDTYEGCWPWKASIIKTAGYGGYRFCGRSYPASRIAWILFHNKDLPGRDYVVRHTCDNRICCNPLHLIVGTQLANLQDMMQKGRRTYTRSALDPWYCGICSKRYPTAERICPQCRKRKTRHRHSHCKRGHLLTLENVWWTQSPGRPNATHHCTLCPRQRRKEKKDGFIVS